MTAEEDLEFWPWKAGLSDGVLTAYRVLLDSVLREGLQGFRFEQNEHLTTNSPALRPRGEWGNVLTP